MPTRCSICPTVFITSCQIESNWVSLYIYMCVCVHYNYVELNYINKYIYIYIYIHPVGFAYRTYLRTIRFLTKYLATPPELKSGSRSTPRSWPRPPSTKKIDEKNEKGLEMARGEPAETTPSQLTRLSYCPSRAFPGQTRPHFLHNQTFRNAYL